MKRSLHLIMLAASLAATATVAGAQAPAGSGFTVIPGIVIPQTAGSTFSIVTAVTIQYGPSTKPSAPSSLSAGLSVSMPGAASKTSVVGIISGPILGPDLSLDVGAGNRSFLNEALSTFGSHVYSIAVTMTMYQYGGGTWSGQSHTLKYGVNTSGPRIVVAAAPVSGSQPPVYQVDFYQH
jgi:hypothetical protein